MPCGQIISVCNTERIIKIGQYLRKLCSNEEGSSFFDSQSVHRKRYEQKAEDNVKKLHRWVGTGNEIMRLEALVVH